MWWGERVGLEGGLDLGPPLPLVLCLCCSIEDIVKGPIGKVTGVADLKLNPLLIIDFNGKEILLPLFDGLIVNVDRESKQLKVNAPEGLIDLYLD